MKHECSVVNRSQRSSLSAYLPSTQAIQSQQDQLLSRNFKSIVVVVQCLVDGLDVQRDASCIVEWSSRFAGDIRAYVPISLSTR